MYNRHRPAQQDLFHTVPTLNDVVQHNELGNCTFVAALAAILTRVGYASWI